MQINPSDLAYSDVYKLLIGAIVPRPIAWVSSMDAEGKFNLAPYSFFTAVCPNPPLVVFCPNIRRLTGQPKDTLRNIECIGEYVINIVNEANASAMNMTSVEAPPEVDEFELVGLTPAPSVIVKPPRVAESPISLECKLHDIIKIGDGLGQGSMVIGQVVYFHIDDRVYIPNYKIDPDALQAIGRMGGASYCTTQDRFEMTRPPSLIKSE
ncbi:MAG: flavin reductase family protein [Phototrophicales bacterium]|nr:MAG: flavin reductase family protein [Phototrophicales bacterium]